MQYRQISQQYANEICKQQDEFQGEDRLSILQEFPHLNARHNKALAECNYDMENNVKCVNKFFKLSLVMLNDYLDHSHTINESPCQEVISTRNLENSALTEYTCNLCLLKFYILERVEEHCKMV